MINCLGGHLTVSADLDAPSSQHAERLTATIPPTYESPGAPSRALGFPERSTVGSRVSAQQRITGDVRRLQITPPACPSTQHAGLLTAQVGRR